MKHATPQIRKSTREVVLRGPAVRSTGLRLAVALAAAGLCTDGWSAPLASEARAAPPSARIVRTAAKPASKTWSSRHFVYRAEGKRLSELLQDFGASQGVPVVTADGLEGLVNANFDLKPEAFLDNISKAYNLLWYYDGTALYFYPGRAVQSRMFRLKGFQRDQLVKMMKSLDVGDDRYPIRYDAGQNTVYVAGPPRHVELVTTALEALDAGVNETSNRTVRVFQLRFASASDRAMGETVIPGVATILRRLYAPKNTVTNGLQDPALDQIAQGVRKKVAPAVPKLANNEFLPPLPKPGSEGIDRQPTQRGLAPPSGEDITPNFEADEGINAVIVQGRGDRMAEYEALIQRLDKKPQLVELEATIIEVSSDSVNALGVDWSMRGRNGSSVSLTAPPTSITPFTLSTVIANAGRELLARVNALQGEGKARVLSKPLVLGVANRAAVMREKRVASVRVASREDANLFQIEAGTLLEMTPQVTTSEGGVNNIKLSLYIEDGNFETASVDQVPIVKKTEIRTEAHVKEGESLLIGGITVESDQSNFAGVPGVSRLPLVGGLFRNREHQTMRMERMFLITPRVLDSEVSARRDAEPKAPTEPAKAVARGTTGAAALGVVTVPALSAPMADAAVQANTSLYVN